MSNNNLTAIKSIILKDNTAERFEQILGKNSQSFISSLLQVITENKKLQDCDPATIMNAAATAAVCKLSILPSLGHAYIIPYGSQAQFQIGWKGLVRLGLRTKQYSFMNVKEIHESQFVSFNPFFEDLQLDFNKKPEGEIVGYAAAFTLVSGFKKIDFWTMDQVKEHARSYSKTFEKRNRNNKLFDSAWNKEDQFDAMGKKTVLKSILNKWGPLSIEMETAIVADQSVQTQAGQYHYIDNRGVTPGAMDPQAQDEIQERDRILDHIANSKSLDELNQVEGLMNDYPNLKPAFAAKMQKLSK